ncbi:MAG: flagellar basal-body MS-ring/collar protein FliF, partial [Myxococcota bacterium]
MNEILAQTRTFYEALSNGQRLGLLASIVASILAIVGVVWWSSVESYSTIYTGSSGELHAVTEDLNEAGIPYRISRDGNQVQVPTSQKGEAMIAAAMSNHTEGLEILKGIDMGTSPSMEREYRTRALELELQKTLNSLTEIQGSRVHIVPLNRISFIGQEKQASASVTIQTGGALSGRQIKGIVRLVSGAVHGLNPQDVTLTDEEGQLLHPEPGAEKDDLISASSSLIELAAQREQAMASALISAAARVLGSPDHIWANVRLDIQQSQMQRTKNLFDPESQVVKSEEVNEERSQSNEPAQGIPGAENNLPEQAPAPAPGDQTESNSITTNYENGT